MTGNRQPGVILQQRDLRLLTDLSAMRLIDLAQAKVIGGFGSYTRTHDRLTRLTAAGFLRRFYVATEAGGRKAVYCLSAKGAEAAGVHLRLVKRKANQLVSGDMFAAHQLAVNDVCLAAKFPVSLPDQARFLRWRSFSQPLSKAALLTPDGYFELEVRQELKPMFVEVDLSSEAHKVWKKKIAAYIQLAVSGEFARLFARQQFRVLVIADSRRRMENLRRLVARTTDKIFWFSTLPSIRASGLYSPIWLRASGDESQPLV